MWRPLLPDFLSALVSIVSGRPCSRRDLASTPELRGLRPRQLERLIAEGLAAGRLEERDGKLHASTEGTSPGPPPSKRATPGAPLRAVAIDFESVVRTTATAPYTERRAFQVAALRFGRDRSWAREAGRRAMRAYCELPAIDDGPGWQITNDAVRALHEDAAVAPEIWLADLDAVLEGADVVVAYNGFELDFPLLDAERQRAGLPPLSDVERVDGLVAALSLFPNPPNNHRLAALAERLSVDLDHYTWHEALSDCRLLATVLWAGARTLRRWDPRLSSLAVRVCDDSALWTLLADLAGLAPREGPFDEEEISALLADELRAHAVLPRRPPPPPSGAGAEQGTAPGEEGAAASQPAQPGPVDVPGELLGSDGRVDPHLLAEKIRNEQLERRPGQRQMAVAIGRWLAEGHGGMVEAPTATGKSLVLFAAALDWVRAAPGRQAIIATHTKQLQGQLAADIQRLADAGVGALADASDLVKGEANRLSLRALTLALADASDPARRTGPLAEPAERELLVYLALRFLTAARLTERWLAQSVDDVDVPLVFERTSEGRLRRWLAALSQSDQGEYRLDPEVELSWHTARAHEALAASPIVIANHALLLAHREALAALHPEGRDLLVLVDEAHELEAAATSALSAEFSYPALERLPGEVRRFAHEAELHQAVEALARAGRQLERFLAATVLPESALRAFDRLAEPGSEPGRRAVAIASHYTAARGGIQVESLRHALHRAHRYLLFMRRQLAWWAKDEEAGLAAADRWTAERFRALSSSVLSQHEALTAVLDDLDLVLGPLTRRVRQRPESGEEPPLEEALADADAEATLRRALDFPDAPDAGARGHGDLADRPEAADPPAGDGAESAADDRGEDDAEAEEDEEAGTAADDLAAELAEQVLAAQPDDEAAGQATAPVTTGEPGANRVVWMSERESAGLEARRRRLQMSVVTSPISLAQDTAWRDFLAATPHLVLTSGTLRVAERWDFFAGRLGLGHLPHEALETPFHYAEQARLYCLSDFPSWAEHPTRAMRTVAHQVAGFERLCARPHPNGGLGGGTMVLTTSRQSAAGIAAVAATLLAEEGVPVLATETLGNARAVETFKATGGVLVGTRGLWQGVDVADAERLRLVWVNKLPFAPFADPIIATRKAAVREAARAAGADDPDREADEAYYLPLAALALRQAVGRLIRTQGHRGVIVLSDNKLAGSDARRRMYRRVFLGSLEDGLRHDLDGDTGAGNVCTMAEAWRDIVEFAAENSIVEPAAAEAARAPERIASLVDLPEMVALRAEMLDPERATARAGDEEAFAEDVVRRSEAIARVLEGHPLTLKPEQRRAIAALSRGEDLLAILPTGFGKSFCYQLPALVLPGVTLVISPLVSLMVDQAMGLGATIGPMVRALTGPMRESNSRFGKSQVAQQLRGEAEHGIRLVYLSPERLADARFRRLVESAVTCGVVRRICVDEAHTLVDWGDDFRPSFRRLDRFLAALKAAHPDLSVSAFTATANPTVREGLLERLFDLPPDGTAAPERRFRFVQASPLRPDLALWRRRLPRGGANAVAGLIEAVVGELEEHAIFYCLTVKEAERVYAGIREQLGPSGADRVLLYHGRRSSAEKSAVATAFKTAASSGQDDFRPMIVVATSAFGLGIDRKDVRAVFCVSPPSDLAALYQQLGRAGRDCSGRVPGVAEVPTNAAMALVTPRSWRTLNWMVTQDLYLSTLRRLADRILQASPARAVAHLDLEEVAADQIEEDIDAGRLRPGAAHSSRVAESYGGGALRVLSALGALGALEDHGDVPDLVRVAPGEVACDDPLWAAVCRSAVEWPAATSTGVGLVELHERLGGEAGPPEYAELVASPADLWSGLAGAHDAGWLDVSQQLTRRRLVVYRPLVRERPAGFDSEVRRRLERVRRELLELRRFFEETDRCVHEAFAGHFDAALPAGCCATAAVRCSSHWNDADTLGADPTPRPALARAFFSPNPRPSSATAEGRVAFERKLAKHLLDLLWFSYGGLSASMLRRVLHGEDSYYSPRLRRRRRLWPPLLHHELRGAMPGVRQRAVDAALGVLEAEGKVARVGEGDFERFRLVEHVEADRRREERRAARAARQGNGAAAPGPDGRTGGDPSAGPAEVEPPDGTADEPAGIVP